MGVGPAAVHAKQHAGPVVGLGAAGAGVDLDEGVIAVGLAGEQRLQLGSAGAVLYRLQLGAGLIEAALVALLVGKFGVADGVIQVSLQRADGVDGGCEARTLAADGLGFGGPVP